MALYGYVPTGRNWDTQLEISGLDAPAETFKLDPSLPALGQDPKFPTDLVAIPRGRIVGSKPQGVTSGSHTISAVSASVDQTQANSHDTVLTFANPANYDVAASAAATPTRPVGFAGYAMYKQAHADAAQWKPAVFKNRLIQVPYIASAAAFTNAAFGNLKNGDYVMAYPGYSGWGSTTAYDPRDAGKIVKWIPRKVFAWTGTAAATATLNGVTGFNGFSPFQPRIIAAFTSGGAPATINTVTWLAGTGWQTSGATSDIRTIIFDYGCDFDDAAGQVLGTELLEADMPGWLRWVQDNYGAWDLPRQQIPGLTTASATASGTSELSLVSTGSNTWTITTVPYGTQIAGYKPIQVKFSSQVEYLDENGSWVVLAANTALPRIRTAGGVYSGDYTRGYNYAINPVNNTLSIWGVRLDSGDTAITTSSIITISFYVETVADGRGYASGQMGITDGAGGSTGAYPGIPRELDVTSSVGILKVMIF